MSRTLVAMKVMIWLCASMLVPLKSAGLAIALEAGKIIVVPVTSFATNLRRLATRLVRARPLMKRLARQAVPQSIMELPPQ